MQETAKSQAVVAYVPPPHLAYAEPFLDNVRRWKPRNELVLFSDHPWPGVQVLPGNPESVKDGRAFTVSNLIFFTGMKLAESAGFSRVLYVEADSRVHGEDWDVPIFEEFLHQPVPAIIGGSVAVHNPCTAGRQAALRWEELVARNSRRNFPVATHMHVPVLAFGNKGSSDREPSCVFCYGSGTVIDMDWYRLLFSPEERNPASEDGSAHAHQFGIPRGSPASKSADGFAFAHLARSSRAWDIELGVRIWDKFGPDSYEVIANLPSVFSGYSDSITSEAERLAMLANGSRRLVHQVKSNANI